MRRLVFLLLLAACSSRSPSPPPAQSDEALDQQLRVGSLALEAGRYEEAARLFDRALIRARERDSPGEIADAATGRSAALLGHGQAAEAARQSSSAAEDLRRRGAPVPAELTLAEAVARFRLQEFDAAVVLLVPLRASPDRDAMLRASFIEGLVAGARRDPATLAAARARIGTPEVTGFRADAAELAAIAALMDRDAPVALAEAGRAAELRRDALDYRGVGRALELSADAARQAGLGEREADFALRAALGASSRGDKAEARRLMLRARAATSDPGMRATVTRELAALDAR
ncbi:MAG: hypothetical protein JWR00_2120 [Rubritepida sp.]|nr:hypothetical protein [Rubritepida sp.]